MTHRKWKTWDCMNIVDDADIRIIAVAAVSEHNDLYDAWERALRFNSETLDENNRLDRELDEARKRIVELERPPVINKITGLPTGQFERSIPLRVPLDIAAMANAGFAVWAARPEHSRLGDQCEQIRARWAEIIRAALAAGGIEPCAMPEYAPADVAFNSRVPELEAALGQAEIEFADLRFYQTEFAAVSRERDNYKEMLDEEVAAASEYMERAEAMSCPKGGDINAAYAWALTELAALRSAQPAPRCADVEALARVLRHKYWGGTDQWDEKHVERNKADWILVASAAIAHIGAQPRPEGLPTAEELAEWVGCATVEAASALRHLAPYLRQPAGWELDVNESEISDLLSEKGLLIHEDAGRLVVNYCRSRIRPVYECGKCKRRADMGRKEPECQECAKKAAKINSISLYYSGIQSKINAARAALEGE